MFMAEYTEGVLDDGVAILKDGVPMTISEILAELSASRTIRCVGCGKELEVVEICQYCCGPASEVTGYTADY